WADRSVLRRSHACSSESSTRPVASSVNRRGITTNARPTRSAGEVPVSTGGSRTVLGAVGDDRNLDPRLLEMLDGVSEVLRVTEPYKLASRAFRPEGTVVSMGDVRIGGDEVIVMAGPCSAETAEQVDSTAAAVKRAGATVLRGGAFKPRSSPY